jgi:hypothetical protein
VNDPLTIDGRGRGGRVGGRDGRGGRGRAVGRGGRGRAGGRDGRGRGGSNDVVQLQNMIKSTDGIEVKYAMFEAIFFVEGVHRIRKGPQQKVCPFFKHYFIMSKMFRKKQVF